MAESSVTNPLQVASSAGITKSGWLRIGDGMWRGFIALEDKELEIEQLAGSWRCNDTGTSARTLELLLKQLLKTAGGAR